MAQVARRNTSRTDIEFGTYLQRIGRFPLLDAADELRLAKGWRDQGDQAAADRLVTAHLRLVVKIARSFRGYGIAMSEVIAEGNVGLLRALRRYDPEKGVRFSTYAMFWIKAAILGHVLNSWSLVRVGTTPAQRKLFFRLRAMKAQLSALEHGDLHPDHVVTIWSAAAGRLRPRPSSSSTDSCSRTASNCHTSPSRFRSGARRAARHEAASHLGGW